MGDDLDAIEKRLRNIRLKDKPQGELWTYADRLVRRVRELEAYLDRECPGWRVVVGREA